MSYALPILSLLRQPTHQSEDTGTGVRALIVAPTRELAHQIHNEFLKLAQGRKWRIVLFSKATANTLADKAARDKIGMETYFLNQKNISQDISQILLSALRCVW